jgi:hypothetical protein
LKIIIFLLRSLVIFCAFALFQDLNCQNLDYLKSSLNPEEETILSQDKSGCPTSESLGVSETLRKNWVSWRQKNVFQNKTLYKGAGALFFLWLMGYATGIISHKIQKEPSTGRKSLANTIGWKNKSMTLYLGWFW